MSLYTIIDELRRQHQTPGAAKTLDLVLAELGRSRDNLRLALDEVRSRPIPPGGLPVLDELEQRARAEGVDDVDVAPDPDHRIGPLEPLEESEIGIGALLGFSSLAGAGLALVAVAFGLNSIFHWW